MTLPAWDLDAPADVEPASGPAHPGLVMVLAVGLAALALGSLAGSVLAPAPPPESPPAATLSTRDLYVDTSAKAADTGAGATDGPTPRIGSPVVVFRLTVDNPGAEPVRLTSIELEGVTRRRSVVELAVEVGAHRSSTVDLTLRADCSAGREPVPVRGLLRLDGGGSSGRDGVPITSSYDLNQPGGLCTRIDSALPRGWRAPLQVDGTELIGSDLQVTIADLSAERLAGILINDRLLPTVYVGDKLVSTSVRLEPGQPTRMQLRGPPPCIPFTGTTPVPSTLRLLVRGSSGVEQQLVVVGPELTRWLRQQCGW